MLTISIGLTLLLALAIIAIGTQYVVSPRSATRSFGLPLPEEGTNTSWWLRLKGVRDIGAGLAVLACIIWAGPHVVGILLLADAVIPVGDMLVVLGAKGSAKAAYGMHGITALVMILTGVLLVTGVH